MIKDGSLTVEEYAKSLLARIEARDSVVHAWAYLDPELVLQRARELDKIAPGKRGTLHGVAVGVKDVILTKDMPTQHNSPIYEDDAPRLDAASVKILRANGALIFGMSSDYSKFRNVNNNQERRPQLNLHQQLSGHRTKVPRRQIRMIPRAHQAAPHRDQALRWATSRCLLGLGHRQGAA